MILDQPTVAGIGNIYADEALHLVRIDPRRQAGSLTTGEVARVHGAIIRTVLGDAVGHGGTSFVDYVNDFRGGDTHLAQARMLERAGEPCAVCGAPIQRSRVAGRGTNICPHCQRYRDVAPAVIGSRCGPLTEPPARSSVTPAEHQPYPGTGMPPPGRTSSANDAAPELLGRVSARITVTSISI